MLVEKTDSGNGHNVPVVLVISGLKSIQSLNWSLAEFVAESKVGILS